VLKRSATAARAATEGHGTQAETAVLTATLVIAFVAGSRQLTQGLCWRQDAATWGRRGSKGLCQAAQPARGGRGRARGPQ